MSVYNLRQAVRFLVRRARHLNRRLARHAAGGGPTAFDRTELAALRFVLEELAARGAVAAGDVDVFKREDQTTKAES